MGEPMQRTTGRHIQECERVLGDALIGFAAELRIIDVVDLIVNVHLERHGHVEDMVNSAAELFFKSGTLRFSRAGHVEVEWGRAATVTICMQLCHDAVSAHFDLEIGPDEAGVHLHLLESSEVDNGQAYQAARFADVLADARLVLPTQVVARYQRTVLAGELS